MRFAADNMESMMRRVYMDYAAATPVDPDVIEAMRPYFFEIFGNPASPHGYGHDASAALESGRETVAGFIGAKPGEIVFTSSATEAVNHVMFGLAAKKSKAHLIISSVEHPCVYESAEALMKQGVDVSFAAVDACGRVDPDTVKSLIRPETALIAVMHANNEIGTIQPVEVIGRIAREHNILFLVDAAQSAGQIPVDVNVMKADFLVLAAHKFYGPKGIAALYIRSGKDILPYLIGGSQEKGRRASTVNVPGAVGMAEALTICRQRMPEEIKQLTHLRNDLIHRVTTTIDGVRLNGHPHERLPKNVHVSIEGISGEKLLMALDMAGIAASQGSACSAGTIKSSRVLKALGLNESQINGALRLTPGRWTTAEDVDYVVGELSSIVKRLRR